MKKRMSKTDQVLAVGFVGLIGVLFTIVSDFILLGRPSSSYEFFKLGTESMANIAEWRITVGTMVGVIALPFQTLGILPVYYGLKPSGRVLPLIFAITNAHALLMGVAFHMSYAYIGSAWKHYYDDKITFDMVDRFDGYWKILFLIMLIEILFCSILYAVILMKGKTLFPKWMAILNPLFAAILVFLFLFVLPAPIGGVIAPAVLNISTMVFVGLSMAFIFKRRTDVIVR